MCIGCCQLIELGDEGVGQNFANDHICCAVIGVIQLGRGQFFCKARLALGDDFSIVIDRVFEEILPAFLCSIAVKAGSVDNGGFRRFARRQLQVIGDDDDIRAAGQCMNLTGSGRRRASRIDHANGVVGVKNQGRVGWSSCQNRVIPCAILAIAAKVNNFKTKGSSSAVINL